MVFWQLTINADDPARLAAFWGAALGYQPTPPAGSPTTWDAHYRAGLGEATAYDDRLFDPTGQRPPLWFQRGAGDKSGPNRLHLDLYPTGRDDALPLERRIEIVETRVAELVALGADVVRRMRGDDPEDTSYVVVLHDPEGNEFCVS